MLCQSPKGALCCFDLLSSYMLFHSLIEPYALVSFTLHVASISVPFHLSSPNQWLAFVFANFGCWTVFLIFFLCPYIRDNKRKLAQKFFFLGFLLRGSTRGGTTGCTLTFVSAAYKSIFFSEQKELIVHKILRLLLFSSPTYRSLSSSDWIFFACWIELGGTWEFIFSSVFDMPVCKIFEISWLSERSQRQKMLKNSSGQGKL